MYSHPLFDSGAQVSCMKHDTIATLGLLHQISKSSTYIGTANGQDVGVKGSIMINFKIGPCSFMHKFIVCSGITRPFILGEEFLSCWINNNKSFTEYRSKIIAVESQVVMNNKIVVSHPVRIPARHFAMVPTTCPNMFSGRVEVYPCPEFRNKLPNLYLETHAVQQPQWQVAKKDALYDNQSQI